MPTAPGKWPASCRFPCPRTDVDWLSPGGNIAMMRDEYGLSLSTTSSSARDAYVDGCHRLLTLYPGALAKFDAALAADPGFALAHAARARALQLAGDVTAAQVAA